MSFALVMVGSEIVEKIEILTGEELLVKYIPPKAVEKKIKLNSNM